ncbi:MAG: hypothetical protein GY940_07450 [bacterium]|nr:hypothetical protein [bacterium]
MSTNEEYVAKLPVIQAIPLDNIRVPNNIPVDIYLQESEALNHWCQDDKDALIAKGLAWELVDDIPVRSGALRESESKWNLDRFSRQEAAEKWAVDSPDAYQLRNSIIHDMRFAYYGNRKLAKKVSDIADGYGHPDMIQDLNDLSVLGKANPDPLTAIGFDLILLDQAAQTADHLASLYAVVTGDRAEYTESKMIRDQAFTHLKEAVDEIRRVGQYLYWHAEHRKSGYRSAYLNRKNQDTAAGNDTTDTTDSTSTTNTTAATGSNPGTPGTGS